MKNILKLPSKIIVHFSTLFTIIISLLINRHRLLFLQYLIAFIHELFHCIGAIIFNLNIKSINFLPFGFYAEFDDLYTLKWYQELIIIILGPLSFFISLLLINYLYKFNSISLLLYNEIKTTNLLILIFNLIPIYPLDGYRILKILIELIFPERKSLKIMNLISLIITFFLSVYVFNNNQIIIISFIIYNQFILIKSFKETYRHFLILKSSNNNESKMKIHCYDDLFRPFNNYVIKNNKIYSERDFSFYLLNNYKRNK